MQLKITTAAMGSLIGYAVGTYPATQQSTTYQTNGTLVPEISPTLSINANCNLANNSKLSTASPTTIYTFSPNTTYGSQIQIVPTQLIYYPVNDGWYNNISVGLFDQDYVALGNIRSANHRDANNSKSCIKI